MQVATVIAKANDALHQPLVLNFGVEIATKKSFVEVAVASIENDSVALLYGSGTILDDDCRAQLHVRRNTT